MPAGCALQPTLVATGPGFAAIADPGDRCGAAAAAAAAAAAGFVKYISMVLRHWHQNLRCCQQLAPREVYALQPLLSGLGGCKAGPTAPMVAPLAWLLAVCAGPLAVSWALASAAGPRLHRRDGWRCCQHLQPSHLAAKAAEDPASWLLCAAAGAPTAALHLHPATAPNALMLQTLQPASATHVRGQQLLEHHQGYVSIVTTLQGHSKKLQVGNTLLRTM